MIVALSLNLYYVDPTLLSEMWFVDTDLISSTQVRNYILDTPGDTDIEVPYELTISDKAVKIRDILNAASVQSPVMVEKKLRFTAIPPASTTQTTSKKS